MYNEAAAALSYWRLASGMEVDFIINDMDIAIAAKASRKITDHHVKGLRSVKEDHADIHRRIVVCCEDKPRTTSDGIEIMPAARFSQQLWQGQIF